MMNTSPNESDSFKIEKDWHKQSKKLQEEFSQLTNEDLEFESGREEELLDRVASRLLKNREEVIRIIKKIQE
jgi:hypothetical protein